MSINKALDTVYTWWDEKLNEIYQILKGSLSEKRCESPCTVGIGMDRLSGCPGTEGLG